MWQASPRNAAAFRPLPMIAEARCVHAEQRHERRLAPDSAFLNPMVIAQTALNPIMKTDRKTILESFCPTSVARRESDRFFQKYVLAGAKRFFGHRCVLVMRVPSRPRRSMISQKLAVIGGDHHASACPSKLAEALFAAQTP